MKRRNLLTWLLVLSLLFTAVPTTWAASATGPDECPRSPTGNHQYVKVEEQAATCTKAGYQRYRCRYCQNEYTVSLSPLGHLWGNWTTTIAPTCTDKGCTDRICRRDPSHVERQWLSPLGHDWSDWYVAKAPTLTEDGIEERKCQRCGLTEQRPIPMLGQKEEYGLALVMTQIDPVGNTFAYEDMFGEYGISIDYQATLINTGKLPLNVSDFYAGAGSSGSLKPPHVLYPGESDSFPLLRDLTTYDIIPGSASETLYGAADFEFYFFGDALDGTKHVCTSNSAFFSYKIKNPEGFEEWGIPSACTVTKFCVNGSSDPNGWQLGEPIEYCVIINNNGPADITNLTVYDDMYGYPEEVLGTANLPMEASTSFTFVHHVTPDDVNRGFISNKAIARWTDPDTEEPREQPSEPVTVTVINKAGLVVTKAVDGGPANGKYYVPGETVHFKVTVANNTAVTQKAIMVVDPLVGETKVCPDIEPGKSETLDFYYEVTEPDAILGHVENYAYTMEIDGISNTVRVDTGFDDPFGVITALEVEKVETSTYTNGHGYEEGDVITYDIIVRNVGETMITEGTVHDSLKPGSGEIGSFENLYPDSTRTFHFSYTVTKPDVYVYGKVVNQAFAWVDGSMYPSNPVESPTWGETPDDFEWDDTPLSGEDFCSRTLTGKAVGTDAFEVHFCGEHLKLLEELEEQKTTLSEEEYLKQAKAAWINAMDKMYAAAGERVGSELSAALMGQRLAFIAYMDTYEALLSSLYSNEPLVVARELEREARERCIDLCYELHEAGKPRVDSVLNAHDALPAATPGETCVRTEGERMETEKPYTEVLCADHATIDQRIIALVAAAQTKGARTNAFLRAQRMWQTPMDTRTNARYKAADKDAKALIAKNRVAFDKYLTARKALLTLLYPGQPDVAAQVIARVIQDKEMDLCQLWK